MKKLAAILLLAVAACSTSSAPAPAPAPTSAPSTSSGDLRARLDQMHQDTAELAARVARLHDALAAQSHAPRPTGTTHRPPHTPTPEPQPPHHDPIHLDPSCTRAAIC